jgi:hypothetical protein
MFVSVLLIFIYVRKDKDKINPNDVTESETLIKETKHADETEISNDKNYKYKIVEEEGRLTVYETTYETIFIETAIETNLLPENTQKDLEDGIYFESDKDMYDFLESYSS